MTNTDPKGFVRAVDEYRATDYGSVHVAPTPHDKFFWLRAGCFRTSTHAPTSSTSTTRSTGPANGFT